MDFSRRLALSAFLFLLPFAQFHPGWLPGRAILADLLVVPALLTALWVSRGGPRLKGFLKYLGLFLALCALSVALMPHPRQGLLEWVKMAFLASIAVSLVLSAKDELDLERWSAAYLAGTACVVLGALLGLVTFYAGWTGEANPLLADKGSLPEGSFPRVKSTFENSNMMCNYLLVAFALTWWRWRRGLISGWKWALGIGAAAATTLSGGLASMLLFFAWCSHAEKESKTTSALRAAALLFLGFVLVYSVTGAKVLKPHKWTRLHTVNSSRLECWKQASARWAEKPLLGWGKAAPISVHRPPFRFADPHNTILSLGSQWGGLGLLAFLLLLNFCLRGPHSRDTYPLRLALFLGLFIQGLLGSYENARHLWVLLGFIVAQQNICQGAATNEQGV